AVFLNGCYLGRSDAGYVPFQFDVSDFLNYGGKNFLVVRVDATYGEGWFYEGAGIYRHVWLTKTDRLHLGNSDSVVRCRVEPGRAELTLATRVANHGIRPEQARVRWTILDRDGRQLAVARTAEQLVRPGDDVALTTQATLHSPLLWSPESPYL